jgi:membrane associated rhomboid family serine protease
VFARLLYLWSQLEGSNIQVALRDLRLGLAFMPIGSEARWKAWPFLTAALVLANVGVFYLGVDQSAYGFYFREPWNWTWSNWTSLFLHANQDHLWANMIFLWIFGSALEGRVGRRQLLLYYLLAGTAGHALTVVGNPASEAGWSRGASGAISGLMGLFIVRCYFSRISFGIPIFGPFGYALPVVSRVRIHPMFLLTLFFLMNLSGARASMDGAQSHINYWAHVGGYFFGLTMGYATGLYRDGLREGLSLRSAEGGDGDYGRSRSARTALLELEPNDIDALLARARERSRFSRGEGASEDYRRVIELLVKGNRARAAEIFLEYFEKYLSPMPLTHQLPLTLALAQRGEKDIAARCLELAVAEPGVDSSLRATALLYEARLLTELDLPDAAEKVYEELIQWRPAGAQNEIAEVRLAQMRRSRGRG